MKALERSVSLEVAENAIDRYFSDQNITITSEKFGEPLSSTVVSLWPSSADGESCVGCGKGYDKEALIGAKYEAYEHYRGLAALRQHSRLVPFSRLLAQPILDDFLPLKLLAKSNPSCISAILFESSSYQDTDLLWPSFLIDYNYPNYKLSEDDANYDLARRYSCGTGFAAGFGFVEAAIHAVSEVIERHCVGTYLARSFFYGLDNSLRYIPSQSMPKGLALLHHQAEQSLGYDIQLIDISIGGLPPVFIACCRDKALSGVYVFGAGCSYYASHAAARAIKELIQQHKVAEGVKFVREEWKRHKDHLSFSAPLLRCLIADISQKSLLATSFPEDLPHLELESHLRTLLLAAKAENLAIWLKLIDQHNSGVAIACAVMPKMERFSVVSLGNYAVPTGRYKVDKCVA